MALPKDAPQHALREIPPLPHVLSIESRKLSQQRLELRPGASFICHGASVTGEPTLHTQRGFGGALVFTAILGGLHHAYKRPAS